MKILHIVPEFNEGGVERYVTQLCHEQVKRGHEISLATAGGKLEALLPPEVNIIKLPVHRKNIFTGLYCVFRLASLYKKNKYKWDIIHAHSRVPAFIAWWTARLVKTNKFNKIKWIMTAHAPYSLNLGIMPLKHADGAICVSEAVYNHLKNYLPEKSITIVNGAREAKYKWSGKSSGAFKFLFVGYLARRKGLDVALNALGDLKNYNWTLDILGDGSQREELEALVKNLKLDDRVKFYGFRDDAEKFMSMSDCLLFPSYQEGLPLTVIEALSVGLPVLASNIEPLRPLLKDKSEIKTLVQAGDVAAWHEAIKNILNGGPASALSAEKLTSFNETAQKIEEFYLSV